MITRRHALASLAAGSLSAPAMLRAQAPTNWIAYSYVPAATLAPAKVFGEIVERVSKETNGGFQIKYHLGGSLSIKVTDITTAVGDDVIQLGDDGFQQGNVPITGILRLPMLITNAQEFEKALAIMKPYVAKAYDKKGSTVLVDLLFPGADRLVEQEAHLARGPQGPEDPRHLARADRVSEALRRQRPHRRRAPRCRRRWSAASSTAC